MHLELLIDVVDIWDLAGRNGKVLPHKVVELRGVALLSEVEFHRSPKLLIKCGLHSRLSAHEDEVSNQIGLTQSPSSRIHAFEDQLRIVLIPIESNIHNQQLG